MDDPENDANGDVAASLEKLEKEFAVKHGFADVDTDPRDIDSVAIHQKAKEIASTGDASYQMLYEKLHMLYQLRTQRYESGIRPGAVEPESFPSIASSRTPHYVDASRFWAVIIGIDGYKTFPLRGCVEDGLLMKTYLEDDLKVPSNRIQLLLGRRHTTPNDPSIPSRNNIMETLRSLINNSHIKKGDNIVIYYSGHGSSYPCSQCIRAIREGKSIIPDTRESVPNFVTNTKGYQGIDAFCPIEALCPIDRNIDVSNGRIVPDISDRELNTVLHEISRVKGNHITVILDCCHSASITREPIPRMRSAFPLTDARDIMLRVGMQNLKSISNRTSVMEKTWFPDMSSHVVLAACREFESAREYEFRGGFNGIFTHSLVGALRSGLCTKELTYANLVKGLPRQRMQTPVVAGDFMRARLWYQTT
ncbi:caspase domain-containing protein [Desarmillaria tabescens]|uniref:Caspase domain-containing protein n=1 Tax=Armillaria tabescens TaxID=1929756 RepID=A0AA39MLJ1_ARMTA|nr:caspase domain-containing protein [Desarmillaria tabescens]KAK0439291.1 caspase domain-containing protein [Desarmillaria tabescens]